tara:strand:+ start:327 stop:713 length:387 start_codon:yes stop_codon:yes gene_type:complete
MLSEQLESKQLILEKISSLENKSVFDISNFLYTFQKRIKRIRNDYYNYEGLEDYKLSTLDYNILYQLYINSNSSEEKLLNLLIFMYSYYKMDGIEFPIYMFSLKKYYDFMNENDNLNKEILFLITNSS